MNIFSQAAQGLNLSPAQRASLKLLKGWVYTSLSVGVMAGGQYLLNNQVVNWTALWYIAGGAFLLSILSALDKYWTSQGDTPLATLSEAGIQRVQGAVQGAQTNQPPVVAPPQAQQAVTPFSARQPQATVLPQSQQPPAAQQAFPPAQGISFNDTNLVPAVNRPQ